MRSYYTLCPSGKMATVQIGVTTGGRERGRAADAPQG